MTPLEEKAYEYASNRYYELTQEKQDDFNHDEVERAYLAGYTEALRWRNVKEELPEVGISVFVKDEYNGNLGKPAYWVSWIDKRGYFTGLLTPGNDYTNHPTHWRPIETI